MLAPVVLANGNNKKGLLVIWRQKIINPYQQKKQQEGNSATETLK